MEVFNKTRLSLLTVFCVCFVFPLSVNAGYYHGAPSLMVTPRVPSLLVEPGGVEIPTIVNVIGPREPNDINDVKELITEANRILEQANVQLNVSRIYTDVNDTGNNDSILTEDELPGVLLGSIFELAGRFGPKKGLKINIADDIWAEMPELSFWHDNFYPVAFLESSQTPVHMAQTLAYQFGIAAQLQPSTLLDNLMNPNGTGTSLLPDQAAAIREIAKLVGIVRSPLAQGFIPDVLCELRHKSPGALFFPEGWTLKADVRNDVLSNGESYSGGPDLEAFIAKTGQIDVNNVNRLLTLKYYFTGAALPDSTSLDTYLRIYNHDDHGKNSDGTEADPYLTYQAVIGIGGIGFGSFSPAYAGVIDLLSTDKQFMVLPDAHITKEYDFNRIKVKAEIPFSSLQAHINPDLFESLNNGRKIEMVIQSDSFEFDPATGPQYPQDYIEHVKFEAVPHPIARIKASLALNESDVSTVAGFNFRSVKPLTVPDPNLHLRDFLAQMFADAVPLAQDVQRQYQFVNHYNFSDYRGFFTADNNYLDNSFPIDGDDNFATEITTAVYLAKGLHIIGAPGKGAVFLEIGGIDVGSVFLRNPPDVNDPNRVDPNTSDPNSWQQHHNGGQHDGDQIKILTRRDWTVKVDADGYYPLRLRSWFGTGGASLELTEVLHDGTRVLLGDADKGGSRAYIPIVDF